MEIHVLRKDEALFEYRHAALVVSCRLHNRARVSRQHINSQHDDAVPGLEMQIHNLALAREVTEGRIEFSRFERDFSALKPSCQIVKVKNALARRPDLRQTIANVLKSCGAACQRNAIPVECPVQFVTQLGDAGSFSRAALNSMYFGTRGLLEDFLRRSLEMMPARSVFDRIRNLRIDGFARLTSRWFQALADSSPTLPREASNRTSATALSWMKS